MPRGRRAAGAVKRVPREPPRKRLKRPRRSVWKRLPKLPQPPGGFRCGLPSACPRHPNTAGLRVVRDELGGLLRDALQNLGRCHAHLEVLVQMPCEFGCEAALALLQLPFRGDLEALLELERRDVCVYRGDGPRQSRWFSRKIRQRPRNLLHPAGPWSGGSPSMCGQAAGAHPDAGEDAGRGAQGPTIEGRGRCKLNRMRPSASPSSSDVSARAGGRDGARRAGAASTQKRGRTRQPGKTRREGRNPPGVSAGVRAGGRPGYDGEGAGGRGRGVPRAARAHRN